MKREYRLAKRSTDIVPSYGIYEVFYDDEEQISFYTSQPITPWGDIPEEIEHLTYQMLKAFDKPPLELDTIDRIIYKKKNV